MGFELIFSFGSRFGKYWFGLGTVNLVPIILLGVGINRFGILLVFVDLSAVNDLFTLASLMLSFPSF